VPAALEGERVDKTVSLVVGVSRSTAMVLVEQGRVHVNGRQVRVRSRTLTEGDTLTVELPDLESTVPLPDPGVLFSVVHEDEDLIVVDKPAGLVVHAGAGHRSGTLVSGLLARYPELAEIPDAEVGETQRPGIVHRLDKGTSGLLVVARTPDAYRILARQFREHSAGRKYLALVAGSVEADEGLVDAPIGRSARKPDRMTVTARGKAASTGYKVEARYSEPIAATLLDATLATGRTHQVRVHLAAIGHPVIGDDRYGSTSSRPGPLRDLLVAGRLFLHAHRLELDHPHGGRSSWESPLPEDLAGVLARLTAH